MNRLAHLIINGNTCGKLQNKICSNKNIFLKINTEYTPYLKLRLQNPNILIIDKLNDNQLDIFHDLNKNLLSANNIYLLNALSNSDVSNYTMLHILNKDNDKQIYIDSKIYSKYMSQLQNFEKYTYGFSLDYSENILPMNKQKLIDRINILPKEKIQFE